MQADPSQLHNLAGDPQQQATLGRLRGECESWMVENRDLGLLSQYELYARSEPDSPLEAGQDPKRNPIRQLLAAETMCGLGHVDEAQPVLITLLSDNDYILRHETLLALCRIGPAAKAALPHLDKARAPGTRHTGIWSFDDVVNDIPLARACLEGGTEAEAKLKLTRQKYLP